jgi:hypothetical protein
VRARSDAREDRPAGVCACRLASAEFNFTTERSSNYLAYFHYLPLPTYSSSRIIAAVSI